MKIAVSITHSFDRESLTKINSEFGHELSFFETKLKPKAAHLAEGHASVCCFVSDQLNSETLAVLAQSGVKLLALRSAGYNHVDLKACQRLEIKVIRVPAYLPHAIAEHATALLLSLKRRIPKAHN